MKAFQQLERLKRMCNLIKTQSTGTPAEFANKLMISESHLYRTIEDLKIYGMPICYSKSMRTYYFERDIDIEFSFTFRIIDGQKLKKVFGGFSETITSLLFFERMRV